MSRKENRRLAVGRNGEALAVRCLERSGYAIVARNWRCRMGEIDIVARKGAEVVFVEVRTRIGTGAFGTPAESVDGRKQARLRRLAQAYLKTCGLDEDTAVRFDVFDIRWDEDGGQPAIRHIPGAF